MKVCNKCKKEKSLLEFGLHKNKKNGRESTCKQCRHDYYIENKEILSEKSKQSYLKSKDKRSEKKKEWYLKNRESILKKSVQKDKEYALKNSDKIKKRKQEYYLKNKEKINIKNNEYALNNKKLISEKNKRYRKNNKDKILTHLKSKRDSDPSYKLTINIRSMFRRQLKTSLIKKNDMFFNYTEKRMNKYIEHFKKTCPNEFISVIEKNKYHIDHIIPCSAYDFSDKEEIKKCWQPENLRLIPAKENIIKSNKIDFELVEYYNIKHLLPSKLELNKNR